MLPKLFSSSPCVDYIHICRNQTDAVVSCLPYSGSYGCVGKCVPESPHSGSAAVVLGMVCIWSLHSGGLPSRELPTSYKDLWTVPAAFWFIRHHKTLSPPTPPPFPSTQTVLVVSLHQFVGISCELLWPVFLFLDVCLWYLRNALSFQGGIQWANLFFQPSIVLGWL